MPSTAFTWPTVRRRKPRLIGKPDLEVVAPRSRPARRRRRPAARPSARRRAAPRVGMLRARRRSAVGRARLDDPAALHDATSSAMRRTMPRSWVMNSIAMPSLACRSFSSVEDLRLHGDVERGRRLVGDEEIRPVGERHGDHHALALAARKLMRDRRRAGSAGSRMPTSSSSSTTRARAAPGAASAVQRQDLADLPLDRVQRVERGHRLLEHHGDLVAAHGAQLRLAAPEQILPLEQDLARRMAGRGRRAGAGSTAPSPICPSRTRRRAPASRPFSSEKDTRIDGERRRARPAEGDGKIADGEERALMALTCLQCREDRVRRFGSHRARSRSRRRRSSETMRRQHESMAVATCTQSGSRCATIVARISPEGFACRMSRVTGSRSNDSIKRPSARPRDSDGCEDVVAKLDWTDAEPHVKELSSLVTSWMPVALVNSIRSRTTSPARRISLSHSHVMSTFGVEIDSQSADGCSRHSARAIPTSSDVIEDLRDIAETRRDGLA